MSKLLLTEITALFLVCALTSGLAVSDELAQRQKEAEDSSEEITDENVTKSRGKGGRVIEYGGQVETNSGVVKAVVRDDPTKSDPKEIAEPSDRSINQKNSVKLITGGDPSDGNAKSGHLPVLD